MKRISLLLIALLLFGCSENASSSEWFESRKELIHDEVNDQVLGYMLLRYLDDSEETSGFDDLRKYLQSKGIELKEKNYTSMTCQKTDSSLSLYIQKDRFWGGIEGLGYEIPAETGYLNQLQEWADQAQVATARPRHCSTFCED